MEKNAGANEGQIKKNRKMRKIDKHFGLTFSIRENLGEHWANLFPKSVATLILASKARTLNSKAVWGKIPRIP